MTPEEIIEDHLVVCEEAHELILEENHRLKSPEEPYDEDFFEDKRDLLYKVEQAVENLAYLTEQEEPLSEEARRLVNEARNLMMKIFLLDRENERLLQARVAGNEAEAQPQAQAPGEQTPAPAAEKPTRPRSRLENLYRQNLGQLEN